MLQLLPDPPHPFPPNVMPSVFLPIKSNFCAAYVFVDVWLSTGVWLVDLPGATPLGKTELSFPAGIDC